MKLTKKVSIVALTVASLALVALPYAARASNTGPGGARIWVGDEVVGPYRLLVSSGPDPATVGALTIVARVSDPQTGERVKDAKLTAQLTGEDGTQLAADLTHEDAGNPVDYAAHIQIDKAQSYEVSLRVAGTAGKSEVHFTQAVIAPRNGGTLLAVGLPFLVILGALAFLFLRRTGSTSPEAGDQAEQSG